MDENGTDLRGIFKPRVKNGIKLVLIMLIALLALYFGIRIAAHMIPFALAIFFSQIMEPFIRFIKKRFRIKRKLGAIIAAILLFGILGLIVTLAVSRIVTEIFELVSNTPVYAKAAVKWLESWGTWLESKLVLLTPEAVKTVNSFLTGILNSVASSASKITMSILQGAFFLPSALILIFVTIVATILMMSMRDSITSFGRKHLPVNWMKNAVGLRNDLGMALVGYIKAQLKIMSFVAVELFIGLLIIGSDYALLLAIIIALLDALPFFGAGLVLIPSAIYGYVVGDMRIGIGCTVLYLVTVFVRQMLEPKVIGKEIGLHPLLTLVSFYGGLQIGGVLGMLFGPVVVLILKNLFLAFMCGRTIPEYIDGKPPAFRAQKEQQSRENADPQDSPKEKED